MTGAATDESLDALRVRVAPAIASAAVFDGWSEAAVAQAAADTGTDPALAAFAFRDGQMTMMSAWVASIDARMAEALPAAAMVGMPVRERIRRLVQFRLDAIIGQEEALSRALAIMAMPQNVRSALRLGWSSADLMWRLAGDTTTDYNHYTKRAILASVYGATLSVFAGDDSEGKAATRSFLDRRLEGILRFEKTKAKLLSSSGEHFSLSRFLGRLRYPAR